MHIVQDLVHGTTSLLYAVLELCEYHNHPKPKPPHSGHRVVVPELLLCCSILAPSAPVTAPPLGAHSAGY